MYQNLEKTFAQRDLTPIRDNFIAHGIETTHDNHEVLHEQRNMTFNSPIDSGKSTNTTVEIETQPTKNFIDELSEIHYDDVTTLHQNGPPLILEGKGDERSCSNQPAPSTKLDLYYQNVRGLRMKTKEFKLSSAGCNHDVIALSETGLIPTIYDGELFTNNDFCVYRCDRSELTSVHKTLGGVLIAVRSHIPSEKLIVPLTDDVELVLVRLRFSNRNVYVCCLYIPSGSPISVYHQYREALEKVIEFVDIDVEDKFYVLGDFNMTEVGWIPDPGDVDFSSNGFSDDAVYESNSLLPHNIDSSANADLLYCLMGSGLCQVNGLRNFQGRTLDLVFCNDPCNVKVSKSVSPMVRIDKYHEPIEIEFIVESDVVINFNPDEHEFNFRKAKFDELNVYLASIDWDGELSKCAEIDSVVDRFYEILHVGFERYVPKKAKFSNSHPPSLV